MNDAPHEIWFFTRAGEKCGPVSFTDLRAMAKDSTLNPRLDMVWSKGMDAWKPAGEVDGLFKRRSTEPPEVPVPTAALSTPAAETPYAPPQEISMGQPTGNDWPGARRRTYLFATLILPLVLNFIVGAGAGLLKQQFGEAVLGVIALIAVLLPLVLWIYFGIQRLPNLGMSRWWFLGNFVPFLNVWVYYRCFACPSGYAYHQKLDGPGIVLAIIFWLMIALGVIVFATAVALMAGALGSPELQQQLQEILRKASEAKP